MKTNIEKYPAYKDSGVEWLGEIPEHWGLLSNKYLFKLKKNQVGKKSGNYTLLSLTLNGIIKRDMENPQGKFPAEFDTYQEVRRGNFVFCLFDVEETPRTVGLSDYDGMITGAYTVMEADKKYNKEYLYYFYLNLDFDKRMKPLYTGLRNTISKDNFFSFKTIYPPIAEQTLIAQFLDRKTALIDQAIGIKQNQIELLKERRQILIHKAVTRGLNPDVPMKDSGVEWIGEIPEGWEVKRLKMLSENIISGPFGSSLIKDEYVKSGFKIYGQEQVIPNDFNIGDYYISEAKFKRMLRYEISTGDILISCVGTFGKIALVPERFEKGIINPRLIKLTPKTNLITPEYVEEALLSPYCFKQFELVSRGGTMGVINIELLSRLVIIIPPLREQNRNIAIFKAR